jgi:hypothetical protein
MIFDKMATRGRQTICKAVLLLTSFIINLHDNWVFGRLPGLIILPVPSGRDNSRPSTGTFKSDTCENLHPDFKNGTIVNTDGIINKLVMVFAFAPAFKSGHYTRTNPYRTITVNKITIPGLTLNRLGNLYHDTRIVHKALYLDGKNACHTLLAPGQILG